MAAFPLGMIIYAWSVERTIKTPLAWAAALGHSMMVLVSLLSPSTLLRNFLFVYLGLMDFLWILTPFWGKLGDNFHRRKMRLADIRKYTRIIRQHPENAAAHTALAACLAESGQIDDAISAYETAILLDPDRARTDRWRLQQLYEYRMRLQEQQQKKQKSTESE